MYVSKSPVKMEMLNGWYINKNNKIILHVGVQRKILSKIFKCTLILKNKKVKKNTEY